MIMLDNEWVREHLLDGEFGIEKEALRITGDGMFAKTPHPFPDDKNIVRDFCENQIEINTGVSDSVQAAVRELEEYERKVRDRIIKDGEYLWNFSNPPYIKDEEDIPIAQFEGVLSDKTVYRNHLSKMYGKYKMTFSGIHVNFSFGAELIKSLGINKDELYLKLAANIVEDGWIITVLLSASPLLDSSFLTRGVIGETDYIGMASVRCSELGYWNHFVPVFDYGSVHGYCDSIREYISEGLISSQTEIYYPVRLKPAGENSLERLEENGINHIELRNIDINPYAYAGIDDRDLEFIHYLIIYEACRARSDMTKDKQVRACINYKNAAHFDMDVTNIMIKDGTVLTLREAALKLLEDIEDFYGSLGIDTANILSYQTDKIRTGNRYSDRVRREYADGFVKRGLELVTK